MIESLLEWLNATAEPTDTHEDPESYHWDEDVWMRRVLEAQVNDLPDAREMARLMAERALDERYKRWYS